MLRKGLFFVFITFFVQQSFAECQLDKNDWILGPQRLSVCQHVEVLYQKLDFYLELQLKNGKSVADVETVDKLCRGNIPGAVIGVKDALDELFRVSRSEKYSTLNDFTRELRQAEISFFNFCGKSNLNDTLLEINNLKSIAAKAIQF